MKTILNFIGGFFTKFKIYIILFAVVSASLIKVFFSIKKAGKEEGIAEERERNSEEKEQILAEVTNKLISEISKRQETISGVKNVKNKVNTMSDSDVVNELQNKWSRENRDSRNNTGSSESN